ACVSSSSGTGSAGPHGGDPKPSPFICAPLVRSRAAAPSSPITASVSPLDNASARSYRDGLPVPDCPRRRRRKVSTAAPVSAEPPATVAGGAVATAAAALRLACL